MMDILPRNHKKNWTIEETQQLLNEIKSKLSIEIIAKNHNRTIKAVFYKFIRHLIQSSNDKKIKRLKFNLKEEKMMISIIPKIYNNSNFIIVIQLFILFLQFIVGFF